MPRIFAEQVPPPGGRAECLVRGRRLAGGAKALSPPSDGPRGGDRRSNGGGRACAGGCVRGSPEGTTLLINPLLVYLVRLPSRNV
eukprot:516823-Prorocentrum_minimum.AAC.3